MTQLNIAIPPSLENWVNTRLAQGRYADAADYVRDLVRRDQDADHEDRRWLKGLIDEGLASGMIDEEPEIVVERFIARRNLKSEIDKGLSSGLVEGEAENILDAVMSEDPDFRD